MPITRSAKKSLRVSRRRHAENLRVRDQLKDVLRKMSPAKQAQAFSIIDKAVQAGIVHTNKGARLKSRLAKKFPSPPQSKSGKRVAAPKKSRAKKK